MSTKKWSEEEDQRLVSLVAEHGNKSWTKISSLIPGRTMHGWMQRYQNYLSPNVKSGAWTSEEDKVLFLSIFELSEENIMRLSDKIGGRKLRFVKKRIAHFKSIFGTHLFGAEVEEKKQNKRDSKQTFKFKKTIKKEECKSENWTLQQEHKLAQMYEIVGPKWTVIQRALGIEEIEVKNYFEQMLIRTAKRIRGREKEVSQEVQEFDYCTAVKIDIEEADFEQLAIFFPVLKHFLNQELSKTSVKCENNQTQNIDAYPSKKTTSSYVSIPSHSEMTTYNDISSDYSRNQIENTKANKFNWKRVKKENYTESDSDSDSRASWMKENDTK